MSYYSLLFILQSCTGSFTFINPPNVRLETFGLIRLSTAKALTIRSEGPPEEASLLRLSFPSFLLSSVPFFQRV